MSARAVPADLDPKTEHDRLERRLGRDLATAVEEFSMIAPGDRVMVAISGGKDSYTMLHLLRKLQRVSPNKFEILAVNLDQGHPGYPVDTLRSWLTEQKYDFKIVHEDTYSIVKEKVPEGKTYCSLCSRLRRGILYSLAKELGCTKIALGHHRDDALATLMLNLVFAGQLKAMPPILKSDDGKNIVIRPLIYAAEASIARYAQLEGFPILPCDLCGSQENLQRKQMQRLLDELDAKNPGARTSMLAALRNVRPTHLLDASLWSSLGIGHAIDDEEKSASSAGPTIPLSRLTAST
ncbi:MAG: tRNA 2-thiocytidine(32) synthetase TtcA [Polyangiales bacterium]